ncbi:unnamed protein product, partial [Amoebophrya sp. A25]
RHNTPIRRAAGQRPVAARSWSAGLSSGASSSSPFLKPASPGASTSSTTTSVPGSKAASAGVAAGSGIAHGAGITPAQGLTGDRDAESPSSPTRGGTANPPGGRSNSKSSTSSLAGRQPDPSALCTSGNGAMSGLSATFSSSSAARRGTVLSASVPVLAQAEDGGLLDATSQSAQGAAFPTVASSASLARRRSQANMQQPDNLMNHRVFLHQQGSFTTSRGSISPPLARGDHPRLLLAPLPPPPAPSGQPNALLTNSAPALRFSERLAREGDTVFCVNHTGDTEVIQRPVTDEQKRKYQAATLSSSNNSLP